MKFKIQYISDKNGSILAIQMPINDWKRIMAKIQKSEKILKHKSDGIIILK